MKRMNGSKFEWFYYSIRKMKESGQLDRLWTKWSSKFKKTCLSTDQFKPVAMMDVFIVFVMLLAANALAVLISFLERSRG